MDIRNSIAARKIADLARAALKRKQRGDASFGDETLVLDARAGLSPAQMVERKLVGLMKNTALPISHMLTRDQATPRPPHNDRCVTALANCSPAAESADMVRHGRNHDASSRSA